MRGNQIGLQLDGPLQGRDRLGLVPAHRERHAEVHQQPGLVRQVPQQFLVDACRVVEPTVAHRLAGGLVAGGNIGGLRGHGRNGEERQQKHCERGSFESIVNQLRKQKGRKDEPSGHDAVSADRASELEAKAQLYPARRLIAADPHEVRDP